MSAVSIVAISANPTVLAKIGLLVAVAAFIVMHPEIYKITNNLTKKTLDTPEKPSLIGRGIHSLVAGLIVVLVIHFAPNDVLN
jgi:hypothetical protein